MEEQFKLVIDGRPYLFKRIFHEDLPLTYHIHDQVNNRLLIFRIGMVKDEWQLLHQKNLPLHVYQSEKSLIKAIEKNEGKKKRT